MKYAVEVGSGIMIHIQTLIKTGSAIQKLIKGDTQRHREHGDRISLLLFFRNKESRPKGLGMKVPVSFRKCTTIISYYFNSHGYRANW
jgi:hypothetical protein